MQNITTPFGRLMNTIRHGDISTTLLLGGLGLVVWAIFGWYFNPIDLANYASLFPFGSVTFWFYNYIFCGVGMWLLVAYNYPPTSSLLLGTWVSIIWSWSAFGRLAVMSTYQTGNATSLIYVTLGILIIQRSSNLKR